MNIQIHMTAELSLPQSVPGLLQVEARHLPGAQNLEQSELTITPFAETEPFADLYGNPCRRLQMPEGDVRVEYAATVHIPEARFPMLQPIEADALQLPTETLLYTLPSRYCQSDLLMNMAQDQFGDAPPGWARVQTICEWINRHITYEYGASDAGTSAYDTAAQRIGVCRDFAHLGIAFCRALGIPARYVSGYCLGLEPPDFHAWFQAYLDGRWVAFDATERQPRPALVVAAWGRDAADCAWSTFFGAGETKLLTVEVREGTAMDAGQ
jgi:transglutaminase-like putative cysteine protease